MLYFPLTTHLTSAEVARLLGAGRTTVQRWIDGGELRAYRTPGRHRRVAKTDLLRFLRLRGMPVPRALHALVRVLVIDDDVGFLTALPPLLRRVDRAIEVELASSGIDGLLAIGARHPDVVLLDAMMAGLDGFEVCRRIHATPETADIAVVGMSGSPQNAALFERAGARHFLPKPLAVPAVVDVLRALGLVGEARRRRVTSA